MGERDAVGRPHQSGHRCADHRAGPCRIEPDRQAFTHAAGPPIDQHRHRPRVDELAAWRHEFEPASANSGITLFGRQHVLLVGLLRFDEPAENASRDAAVATAWRIPKIHDQSTCVTKSVERAIERGDDGVVAERIMQSNVANARTDLRGSERQWRRWRTDRRRVVPRFDSCRLPEAGRAGAYCDVRRVPARSAQSRAAATECGYERPNFASTASTTGVPSIATTTVFALMPARSASESART